MVRAPGIGEVLGDRIVRGAARAHRARHHMDASARSDTRQELRRPGTAMCVSRLMLRRFTALWIMT
jgi:hypothetical protein